MLERLYLVESRSTVEISRELKISRNTLLEHMEMHGIPRRMPGAAGALASRRHEIDERHFQTIDHPDKAYIVGFILGDGALIAKGRSSRLQIILAREDRDHLVAIAERLRCAGLVRERPADHKRWQPKVRLVIDRTQLVRDLVTAGIPMSPKSGREPFIRCATPELTWALIRGVSDADGCIRVYERSGVVNDKLYGPYRRARWSLTIGRPFIEGLCLFCMSRALQRHPHELRIHVKIGRARPIPAKACFKLQGFWQQHSGSRPDRFLRQARSRRSLAG